MPIICAAFPTTRPSSNSSITGSTCRAFRRRLPRDRRRDGSGEPVTVISVGRLVEKKGYDLLLDALARLPATLNWRFVHIGGGDLSAKLKAQAQKLGLSERIEWRGSRDQNEVIAALREADIFVLPSRIASDGDRDGLPNVLDGGGEPGTSDPVDQQFHPSRNSSRTASKACSSSPTPKQLAEALARMIADPEGRARLAAAARKRLVESFGMDAGIDRLVCPAAKRPGLAR